MMKISKILRKILSFFDKCLITPITKLILLVTDRVGENSKSLEKFINRKQTLIVISLICAFTIFLIVDKNSDSLVNKSAEILYGRPVTAIYNEEAYVVEGLPSTVDITLIGRSWNLYLAKQYPSSSVSVDLRGLKPGSHTVKLKYSQDLASLDYKIDPSNASIVIYEKVSATRELDYDLLHRDNLDSKFVINNVELNRNDVIIKGPEYKLKQVATVKALVDIESITKPAAGKFTLKDIPLIAYDTKGQIVEVEIVPGTVDAQVEIASPSKEVPIKVVPTGELAFGKSISNISVNHTTVIVYGNQSVLDKIESLDVELDVSGLDKDKEFNKNLTKPSGVRDLSVKTLNISVTLDDVVTKEISGVKIYPINLDPKFSPQASSAADSEVTIIVKGSKSVIESLDLTTLRAEVDLSGYNTEGEVEAEVIAVGGDIRLTYESKTKKVKIKITKSN